MKTLKVMLALVLVLTFSSSHAQNTKAEKENLPIDKKTNCYIRYYYFPNLQAYFDNLEMVYYYKENGVWKTAPELPKNYGGYSLYNKARVTITDYDDDQPYNLLQIHKKLYPYNSKGRFINQTASSE
ncbi:hypothetical protein IVB69_04995 [Flavobacterium sp. J49]|uniref:hypothetical protein n=1 Tax=Flavobacterium sp. J49 TaxID=2718534 RepID=UPI001593F1D4|nr:hypothetical protein [Flavobacterium sp. J49]MBF6640826.1 hypothetical protein [Flavobacterium sp. J49]NIC02073.1 hypothetical protein [Flavobacterium sp. J49]